MDEEMQAPRTYYFSEAMLGDDATEQEARRMVEILKERGFNVAYGYAHNGDSFVPAEDWQAALDQLSSESIE